MEKKSRWENWLSLILSFVAIVISMISLVYTIRRDKMNEVENIKAWGNWEHFDEVIFYNYYGGDNGEGTVDGLNHSYIISNNSKIRASVVSYEVWEYSDIVKKEGKKRNNMVAEIKDALGNPAAFPITLEAGEAVSIQFEMKYVVPADVNELLIEKYGETAIISYKKLRAYLDENEVDIWDTNYHLELLTSDLNVLELGL